MLGHLWHLAAILILLGVANGTPIFAKKLLGTRFAAALDGGAHFLDGRPLLGSSKTIRGLATSLAATTLAAPLLGFDWIVGTGLAGAALVGDSLSSFVKRRLDLKPHSQALGLDQIPESLLPLWLLRDQLNIGPADMAVLVTAFLVLELLLSRLLFRLHIRDRPY